MYNFSRIIISLFGIGFFPLAPGTISSLISIIFFYFIYDYLSLLNLILIFLFFFLISILLIKIYTNFTKKHDSSEIVIDEFLGINLIIIFYEYYHFANKIIMFSIIFIIFRFFDIIKIYPANLIDKKVKNSLGVILDDIIAGVYSIILLYILNVFL